MAQTSDHSSPTDGATSTAAVLTVRVIRSFEHRNIRPIVLHGVDLDHETGASFLRLVLLDLAARSELPPPLRHHDYDALKVTHKAHGAKTNNPVINVEDDGRFSIFGGGDEASLRKLGVEHETELSLFKMDDYQRYKQSLVVAEQTS